MSIKRKLRVYVAGPLAGGDLCRNVNRATEAFLALAKAGCAPMCPHWSVYARPAVRAWTPEVRIDDGAERQQRHRFTDDFRPVLCEAALEGNPELDPADWTNIGLAWVDACDFLVRLPGKSSRADAEVARAMERAKPVFHGLDAALLYAAMASRVYLDPKAGAA